MCNSTTFALRHTQISHSSILRHFRPPSRHLLLNTHDTNMEFLQLNGPLLDTFLFFSKTKIFHSHPWEFELCIDAKMFQDLLGYFVRARKLLFLQGFQGFCRLLVLKDLCLLYSGGSWSPCWVLIYRVLAASSCLLSWCCWLAHRWLWSNCCFLPCHCLQVFLNDESWWCSLLIIALVSFQSLLPFLSKFTFLFFLSSLPLQLVCRLRYFAVQGLWAMLFWGVGLFSTSCLVPVVSSSSPCSFSVQYGL